MIICGFTVARPPVDLIFSSNYENVQKRLSTRIKEEDLVFVNSSEMSPEEKKLKENLDLQSKKWRVKSNILGRRAPKRAAKANMVVKKQHELLFLKKSRNSEWYMMRKKSTGKRTWLPKQIIENY